MECHSRLSSGANQLMEAFPMHEDNDWSDTIEAWHWVSVDVARRLWMEPDEPDFQVNIVAENVLHAENSQGSTFFMRINLGKIGSHALILVMILLLIPWILAGFLPDNPVVKTILFALRLVGLIGYGLAFKRISAWSEQRTSQTLLNSYEDRWRPIMTRMLSGTNGNFQAVCGVLNYLIEESEYQTNVAPYLLAYVARDYGLQLFSHSQMFIK
jgi:hypothetical protein